MFAVWVCRDGGTDWGAGKYESFPKCAAVAAHFGND